MNLILGKEYEVMKRIKIHTSPLRMADVVFCGTFMRETKEWLLFDSCRARESNIVSIREKGGAE